MYINMNGYITLLKYDIVSITAHLHVFDLPSLYLDHFSLSSLTPISCCSCLSVGALMSVLAEVDPIEGLTPGGLSEFPSMATHTQSHTSKLRMSSVMKQYCILTLTLLI